jgi:hypothetical protein
MYSIWKNKSKKELHMAIKPYVLNGVKTLFKRESVAGLIL